MGNNIVSQDANYIMLQILRQIGKEEDTLFYLYDVEAGTAYFNSAITKLFEIPEIVEDMPDSIMKRDFLLPESKEEFVRLHKMITEGSHEVVSSLKLKSSKGINTIYELRLTRINADDGTPTRACIGRIKDVTERYVKDIAAENYNKVLGGNTKFQFSYNKKKDVYKISYTDGELHKKEKNFFFYSRLVKEEKVCSKNDIPVFLDFLNNGSEQPIQIELFDQSIEEYRWYMISGKKNSENDDEVVGVCEDITDLKTKGNNKERLNKVLNILSADYLFIAEIDLVNDSYEALLGDYSRLDFQYAENGKYSTASEVLSEKVSAEYRKKRLEFGSIENIKKELVKKNKIVLEFKTTNENYPWRLAIIQKSECDEFGNPLKVLLSHIYIDESELTVEPERTEEINEEVNDKVKILIVEDYELNAKLAAQSAEIAGMEADWAASKKEALDKLKANNSYKMILMDDKLKDATGIDASKSIREMQLDTPIILCSLHDGKELDESCKEAGINSHVAKPLVAKQLYYLKNKYVE